MDVNQSVGDLDNFGDDASYSCSVCRRPTRSLQHDGLCDRCAGLPPVDRSASVYQALRAVHLRAAENVAAIMGWDDRDVRWHMERADMMERRARVAREEGH